VEFSSSIAFAWGILGAFVVYYALYRHSRIAEALRSTSKRKLLAFDLLGYLLCGGLIAVIGAETVREAFLIGSTWQGIAGGFASGTERELMRKHIREQMERPDDHN